ncbi:hypothetical protein K431DRAFT_284288 [Polychaeton citri CBS 116435]|uniref:TFIIS N-terminal domain-containing protein n=1 Tax=Polychaeton citri CBS 116435 TaxID=1314669 RepID=A0A9P4QBZ0_9PEZI|nr:hypothetical protein K431DRAFT_284288 [Polychaeton citri CBS 116435]
MEDLEQAPGSPTLQPEPEGNNDPGDPLQPSIDEGERTPPLAEPTADMDAREDDATIAEEAAERVDEANNEFGEGEGPVDDEDEDGEGSKDEDDLSEISELDEQQFDDFDPNALNIPDKPVQVDSDNVGLLGTHKRKRTAEEEEARKKKKKEGRREKPKKKKRRGEEGDDGLGGGDEVEGRRSRRSKAGADGRAPKAPRRERTPENEDLLAPEERRRRALERKMDEALRSHRAPRRKQGEMDTLADEEIATMRTRMANACGADAQARERGEIATHKLKLLPAVMELLNRNNIQQQLADPDLNILESVRFFLEPADQDASLPNYQIQRELFSALMRLPITKEALIASGIGKVVLYYTKSIQPQPNIKRQAEALMGEWTREVLKKRKDFRGKEFKQATYDPLNASQPSDESRARERAAMAAERKELQLRGAASNRAQKPKVQLGTYTVAPVNNLAGAALTSARRAGQGGEEAFRRVAARAAVNQGKRAR